MTPHKFNPDRSYGTVYGDPEIGFVQDGHSFSHTGRLVKEAPPDYQEPTPVGRTAVRSPQPSDGFLDLGKPDFRPIEDDPELRGGV